ncbi:hypothetical protein NDA10_003025 [Ustilago hordei]|nr:hypothetical protein NDA10_003025 [Ustilago hordei]
MRNPETWVKKSYFGLTAAKVKEGKDSLNPTVHEALAGKDRRFWEEAMRKELDGLEAMGTWETTDLPRGMNTVDTRWVLKIKTDANLIPTKYKARLVARGFTQREGLDYTEIFAPVAPIQAIRECWPSQPYGTGRLIPSMSNRLTSIRAYVMMFT